MYELKDYLLELKNDNDFKRVTNFLENHGLIYELLDRLGKHGGKMIKMPVDTIDYINSNKELHIGFWGEKYCKFCKKCRFE